MPDREIIKIPANRTLADLRRKKRKLRVAAYCRVSTEEEEQQSSFEIQVAYYTNLITNHEGWELTGIFADEGISGVRTNKREQFKEMITPVSYTHLGNYSFCFGQRADGWKL